MYRSLKKFVVLSLFFSVFPGIPILAVIALFMYLHSVLSEGWFIGVVVGSIHAVVLWYVFFGTPRWRYRHLKGTGIEGTARAMTWPESDGESFNVIAGVTLRVSLPGREPYLVKQTLRLKERQRAAFISQSLPVWVDPKDRNRVFIDWEQVPSADELARQKHEAMLRGERVD